MGKNQKAIKVLQRLFDAGYGTEKEIVNMAMDEMLALPGVNVADLCIISELQKSIKSRQLRGCRVQKAISGVNWPEH